MVIQTKGSIYIPCIPYNTLTQWFMLSQPSVEERLMTHRVQSGHDNVWSRHLVGFDFDLRDLS